MRNPARRGGIAAGLMLAAAVVFAGCSSSSDSGTTSTSTSSETEGAAEGGSTTVAVGSQLFSDNFTSVCQGVGQSRARTYEEGGTHKAVFIQTYKDHLQDASHELPTDWTVQFDPKTDAFAAVDVVGCSERKASTFAKECTGYERDGKETGNTVKLYTASYEVTVREATTGKVLDTTTLEATSTDCPMFQSFEKDQKSVDVYQTPVKDEIVAFMKPYVQP